MDVMSRNPPRLFGALTFINEQSMPLSNYNSITNIRKNSKSNSNLYTSSSNNLKRNSRNHYTYLNLNENAQSQSQSYLLGTLSLSNLARWGQEVRNKDEPLLE